MVVHCVAMPAGKSVAASARNVGAAAAPVVGPAKINAADWVASDAVSVPAEVTGEFVTVKIEGIESPTVVTDPAFGVAHDGLAAAPPVCKNWPDVPGASGVQPVALRYKIEP